MCSMHPTVVSAVLFMAFITAVDPVNNTTAPPRGLFKPILRTFRDPGFSELLNRKQLDLAVIRGSVVYVEIAVPVDLTQTGHVLVLESCSCWGYDQTAAARTSFIRDKCPVVPEVTVLENGVSHRVRFSVLWSAELVPADYVYDRDRLHLQCEVWMAVSTCSPVCPKRTYDFSVKKEL